VNRTGDADRAAARELAGLLGGLPLALEQGVPSRISLLHSVMAFSRWAVVCQRAVRFLGEHLGIPVVSITPEEAAAHFGFLAGMLQLDVPASSAITRQLLGWQPTEPGILADLHDDRLYRQ
jgi:hypothetical protein